MLISVIIAVYNGESTLLQCLASVFNQSYGSIELIVIDGGSTDGTVNIIKKNDQYITYWVSEPDLGIYNAWNKALARSTGDWICFLGADDFLCNSEVLTKMVGRLRCVPAEIDVAYAQIMLINNKNVDIYAVGESWGNVKDRFKQTMCVPHPAVMHKRSLFVKHGNFDESFRIAGDYEFLLRELIINDAFFIDGIVFTAMRQGGISTDPANTLLGLREVRLAQIKNGLVRPGLGWQIAVSRAYVRLWVWRFLGEKRARKLLDIARRIVGLPAYWTKT